jgi:putative endonuclease
MHYVYILKSEKDGRLYKGMTFDLAKRLQIHNQGKVRATKGYRPWRLVYSEEYSTMMEARSRELYFKSGVGRDFLKSMNL